MLHRSRTPVSEFPNDNPELHDGAIWVCLEPCGPLQRANAPGASAEARLPEEEIVAAPEPNVAHRPSMILPAGTHLRDEEEAPRLADLAEASAADVEDDIVIEELEFFEAPEPAPSDPFLSLVATLADVARGAGDTRAAAVLPAFLCDGLLDSEAISSAAIDALREGGLVEPGEGGLTASASLRAVAGAWSRVLRGESDDISACGSAMLDEWGADLVARLLGAPSKTAHLRRELRSRGIAAFGLAFAA